MPPETFRQESGAFLPDTDGHDIAGRLETVPYKSEKRPPPNGRRVRHGPISRVLS